MFGLDREKFKEFYSQYDNFALDKYIQKLFPNTKFEEEIDKHGKLYLKTNTLFMNTNSKLPSLYLTSHDSKYINMFKCYDTLYSGGPYTFFQHIHDNIGFEKLQQELGTDITITRKIITLEEELSEYESIAEYAFDTAYLADKCPYADGSWDY